jgi:hypothetical protein
VSYKTITFRWTACILFSLIGGCGGTRQLPPHSAFHGDEGAVERALTLFRATARYDNYLMPYLYSEDDLDEVAHAGCLLAIVPDDVLAEAVRRICEPGKIPEEHGWTVLVGLRLVFELPGRKADLPPTSKFGQYHGWRTFPEPGAEAVSLPVELREGVLSRIYFPSMYGYRGTPYRCSEELADATARFRRRQLLGTTRVQYRTVDKCRGGGHL